MNALANDQVGDYLNEHFVSSFLKVGTFTIANGQKQGGNVATYFCLPDGSVLHAIAGPVNANTMLREARWVVETRKLAMFEAAGNQTRYKELIRKAHGERLQAHYGINLHRAVTFVPRIPDVELPAFVNDQPQQQIVRQARTRVITTTDSPLRALGQQEQVHLIMVHYPLIKVQQVYKYVFERVLGEKVSNLPVAQN